MSVAMVDEACSQQTRQAALDLYSELLKLMPTSEDERKVLFEKRRAELAEAAAAAAATGGADSGGEQKKKYKWSVAADNLFKFDHKKALPAISIGPLNWTENTKGLERAPKGSEGLFFCSTTTSGDLIVKRSKAIGSEVFCTLLAARLHIATPLIRILPTNSEEGLQFVHRLRELDPTGAMRTVLYAQSYILLLSYLRAQSLNELDYVAARALFGAEDDTQPLQAKPRALFEQLGAMLCLDVLVNNCDRLPFIWEHRGNPGNVMLDAESVYSIDGQIVAIGGGGGSSGDDAGQYEAERDAYLSKVDALFSALRALRESTSGGDSSNATAADVAALERIVPAFASVRDKLKEWTEFDIGARGIHAIIDGFQACAKRVVADAVELKECCERWSSLLRRFEPPLADVNQIQPSFVAAVIDRFNL